MQNFKELIAQTKAFIFDVDGVMTDGGIMPIEGGTDFIRKYNAKDGYAIAYAIRRGYKVCIISGGHGNLLRSRLERLGVSRMYLNCMNKIAAMEEFFREEGVDPKTTIYMGDDIPDLECMEMVGLPVCPADACSDVVEASCYVSEFNGGAGAVRDIIEQVLRSQDEWAKDRNGVISVASR